mgnify:CR=1 FL=1
MFSLVYLILFDVTMENTIIDFICSLERLKCKTKMKTVLNDWS